MPYKLKFSKEDQVGHRKKGKKAEIIVSEDDLQKQCNDTVESYGIKYLRIPDGVWNWFWNNAPVEVKFWFGNYFSGMPDNLMLIPIDEKYNLCCQIELKTKTGKLRAKQREWKNKTSVQISRDTKTTVEIVEKFHKFANKLKKFLEKENK